MKNVKTGFSLIEAMLAIVIITIVAVGALSYLVYCDRLALQADARIDAANVARETAEDLYKRDYNDSALNATTGISNIDSSTAGSAFHIKHPGTTTTRVYTITNSADNNYKTITVTVNWSQ